MAEKQKDAVWGKKKKVRTEKTASDQQTVRRGGSKMTTD